MVAKNELGREGDHHWDSVYRYIQPIGIAKWTPPKIRKFSVVWIFILQICSASPIQETNDGSSNIYGFVNVHILL